MDFGLYLEFASRQGVPQHEVFRESFALVDEAERLGVDSMWLAEYHFTVGRSVLSAPVPIACAIASRTARARIGLAVLLLPLGHPIRIAEEVATLDHISQGRLEFGIGRGTFPNVHEGFRVPFTESRRRFEEYLDIILQAWTTESLSYEGEYFSCQEVTVSPKPYQTPYPPISVGITSAETFPIIGRAGYAIIINPSRVFALAELAPHIQAYRQAWKEAGHPGAGKVGLRIPVYVAASAKRAYTEPQESTLYSMRRLGERVTNYGSRAGTTGDWSAEGQRILRMSYDNWLRDKVAYGTPDAVADRLGQLRDELTLDHIIYEINFGNQLPFALQMHNLRLMQEKVIPQLA
jgi:alkanesulfonate monooxygenase SsuD/methylene tetrahydromethanopterin reductase-like flavin-dependent oxidoreductase (luciferase family)